MGKSNEEQKEESNITNVDLLLLAYRLGNDDWQRREPGTHEQSQRPIPSALGNEIESATHRPNDIAWSHAPVLDDLG